MPKVSATNCDHNKLVSHAGFQQNASSCCSYFPSVFVFMHSTKAMCL